MTRKRTWRAVMLAISLVAACTAEPPTPVPSPSTAPIPGAAATPTPAAETPGVPIGPAVLPVEVSPSAALLTGVGQTVQLTAQATTTDGAPVPVTWRSSDPSQVTVDGDGTVTSVSDLGSAIVFAEAGDRSTPVIVVIAQPAPGALLIDDEQVVAGPEPVGELTSSEVGSRTRVTVSGLEPPSPGTIILARASAAIAGRVVSAAPAAGGTEIEYELVPMPELFDAYLIELDMPLDVRDTVVDDATGTTIIPDTDGSATIRYRDPMIITAAAVEKKVEHTFKRGPLKCTFSASAKFQMSSFDITLSGKPTFQFAADYASLRDLAMPRYAKLALIGPLTYSVGGGFKAQAGFEGKAECSLIARIPIPITGWLAALITLAVPVGIGATAEGTLTAVEVDFGPRGTVGAEIAVGLECQGGICIAMDDINPQAEIHFESKAQIASDMKVKLSVTVHAITGLDVIVATEPLGILDVRMGLKQSLDLAFADTQARDPAYASAYDLKLVAAISPGDHLKAAIEKIIGDERDLTFDITPDEPLAKSPTGRLSAEKTRVQVDKPVKLFVDLEAKDIDYVTVPNVVEIRIERREKDGSLRRLGTVPVAASGQTHFEWTWTPEHKFLGMNELVAFVVTEALPLMPLEVAADSTASVEVVEACLPEGTPPPVVPPSPGSSPGASAPLPTPAASPTPPPEDPCSADVTIDYQSTSYLHASQWTITGDLERYVEGMPLGVDQPTDDFVGTGTYQGSQQIALSCGLPAETWAGNGDVYLTGTIFEEGWIGADFIIEGPAMLIGVFHAGDIPLGEGIPNYLDLILIPVPLAGGTTEYHFVKAAEAECNDEWATTTKVSLSPEVAAP